VYVDPVHMNAEGYEIVARSVATRLEADIADD